MRSERSLGRPSSLARPSSPSRPSNTGQPASVASTLTGLLIASLVCISILVVAVATGKGAAAFDLRAMLIVGVLAGVVVFAAVAAYLFVAAARKAADFERKAADEMQQLERRLQAADAIIRSEPQILVFWEPGQSPRIAALGLNPKLGVPQAPKDVIRFGGWMDVDSASQLASHLDRLFRDGRAFNLMLRTRAGCHLEADGRVAGGRAVLKLREVVGQRLDLAELSERSRQQANALERKEALYQALPNAVWFRAADGRIDWVNEAYATAVRAESPRMVIERQIQLLEERQLAAVDQALARGEPYSERIHVIFAGERRTYDIVAASINGQSALMANDVGALETAQSELSRQTEAHDRVLDRVASAVAIFGPDQRLTFCNEAYRKLWHLDVEWLGTRPRDGEILDRLREERRLPEEADYRVWKRKLLACYGTDAEFEDWWHLPDGRAIHVIAEQRPDGGVTYLYDDVTERFALESRFTALSRVQRETIDHLTEGVAVFATDGRLRLFNPAFARIWRVPIENLGDEPHIDHVMRQCESLHDVNETWQQLKRAATALMDNRQQLKGTMNRPDGSVVAYAGRPLPDGAMLFTFIDITDSKRVEQALIQRNEALQAADRLKSKFISHVSYELRTPLTNIIGFSELLTSPRTGNLNIKQREYLGDIHASSRTLLAIINDILDLATIDAGALELSLAPIEAGPVIEAATGTLADRMHRAKLDLVVDLAPDTGTFLGDVNRVRQVLSRLLANAIGFSEHGDTIRISSWREDGKVAFAIEDQGCGIPEEQLHRVFERFESRTQGSKHRGAGLGLAIVKSLVELHGGSVELVSRKDEGTTVTVRFLEAGPRSIGGGPDGPAATARPTKRKPEQDVA